MPPQAPRAPPRETPGASAADLSDTDLQKPGLLVRSSKHCTHVHWAVDGRKLERQDKQLVSPSFTVILPEHGPTPFKIVLHAKDGAVNGKRGAGFVKVKGRGRIVLKCESPLPESCSDIAFRVGVGRNDVCQPFRGPVVENFHDQSCHGLPMGNDEWDFSAAVDKTNTFLITMEIAPKTSYLSNSTLWWAPLESDTDA